VKWFKHLAESYRDPDFANVEVEFGTAGPYVFWRVLEVLAMEDAVDKKLVMPWRTFANFFPAVKPFKLRKILQAFSDHSRFILRTFPECSGNVPGMNQEQIEIICPKFDDISSDYRLKVRRVSEQASEKDSLEEEVPSQGSEKQTSGVPPSGPSKPAASPRPASPDRLAPGAVREVVEYLNLKAGTSFKPTAKATMQFIKVRLKEGFTVKDFVAVIDGRVSKWKSDAKMREYLRPQTLFGTKFESYLQENNNQQSDAAAVADAYDFIHPEGSDNGKKRF